MRRPTETRRSRRQRAFTLVELLIVVLILAILAAVAIPRFNGASAEAKEAALVSNLHTVRQAIEMYRVQHLDKYPGHPMLTMFKTQLTSSTHADGSLGGAYGPYLRGSFPKNPFTGQQTVYHVSNPSMLSGAKDIAGYAYAPTTGEFRANQSGNAPSGTPFWDL